MEYYHKNVPSNSSIFCNRYANAFFRFKEHIKSIISNLKISYIYKNEYI